MLFSGGIMIIGSHVSFHKDTQLFGSLEEALSYGANTFMFYTGAPQNTKRFPIIDEITLQAYQKMREVGIDLRHLIVHAPYIINLASDDVEKYRYSVSFLREELHRIDQLGIPFMVLHPGNYMKATKQAGILRIQKALNELLMDDSCHVTILLETMAGKGTEIGSSLEEIKQIIDGVTNKKRIGVCLDTCHLHDAGYDLRQFDLFLQQFDALIGMKYVHCIHVNDSKNEMGSHKDRHENIGYGKIGFATLLSIVYHPLLDDVPKILETPYIDRMYPPYRREIAMLLKKKFDSNLLQYTKTDAK